MQNASANVYFEKLEVAVSEEREVLCQHPVYKKLSDLAGLRVFMEHHIFAVWDFMVLLKTLQRRLTCTEVFWLPRKNAVSARFINEIVLNEESDEVSPGVYCSHFDLYLQAMSFLGADIDTISAFLDRLRDGSLSTDFIPSAARGFFEHTLAFTDKKTHEVAAAFLFGREDIIPSMFNQILDGVVQSEQTELFRLYLERHIHLDGTEHRDLAKNLLIDLCGDDVSLWEDARVAAVSALESRSLLWDGVSEVLVDMGA